ncbi:hypothetical protein G6F57_011967 [Rhizopus arrhizus]|nr:hypothetical protein G6F57_011967 [Rhizopus arrhizus]
MPRAGGGGPGAEVAVKRHAGRHARHLAGDGWPGGAGRGHPALQASEALCRAVDVDGHPIAGRRRRPAAVRVDAREPGGCAADRQSGVEHGLHDRGGVDGRLLPVVHDPGPRQRHLGQRAAFPDAAVGPAVRLAGAAQTRILAGPVGHRADRLRHLVDHAQSRLIRARPQSRFRLPICNDAALRNSRPLFPYEQGLLAQVALRYRDGFLAIACVQAA